MEGEPGGGDDVRIVERPEHDVTIGDVTQCQLYDCYTYTVLKELPENLQADVVYRMAILESIQPGVVSEIDEVLSREMQAAGAMGTSKVGGIEAVAEMLNSLDKSTETRILATIEESNPDLAVCSGSPMSTPRPSP